jgi:phosphoglycolate phosphatase
MLAGVVFDLDGTLLDTLTDLAACTNAALAALGQPGHPLDAYRYLVGEGMEQLVRRALPPAARDEARVQEGLALLKAGYEHGWMRHTRPYPGIAELLDRLVGRGVAMAVLSNKADAFTQVMVEHYLGRWPFVGVRGSRPDVPRKPDPAAALELARELGCEPARLGFVGDTAIDVKTARAAGMHPIGVLWGFRGEDELRLAGATRLVRSPAELATVIEELG